MASYVTPYSKEREINIRVKKYSRGGVREVLYTTRGIEALKVPHTPFVAGWQWVIP
jgi:hypothetical protein